MQRSGAGEVSLGDVIDEMRNLLVMLTGKHKFDPIISDNGGLVDFFYGAETTEPNEGFRKPTNLRISHFSYIISELTECGVLTEQSTQSERHRMISLNVSEDEVKTALDRDLEILAIK